MNIENQNYRQSHTCETCDFLKKEQCTLGRFDIQPAHVCDYHTIIVEDEDGITVQN